MNASRALRGLLTCVLGLLILQAEDAVAAAFTVTPVRIFLGHGANSALLAVRNESPDPIRFQVSLRAWNQSANGEMQLSDTADIVFFPTMFELKPGEQKNVRVGLSLKTPVPVERSYRIFFEELPPAQVAKPKEGERGAEVKVLTKMGVPIFVQPASIQFKAQLDRFVQSGRNIDFDVSNAGNSFFSIGSVSVTGFSKSGVTTFEKKQDGWYVLAGGMRHYQFEIPADKCSTTDHVLVDVVTSLLDQKGLPAPLNDKYPITASACGAGTAK